jgi:D-arabinose 1-dehydrogenase-like Zn-dependent alcohol dehydrogenase
MRALVLEAEKLQIKEIPLPHLSKNEALIKVLKAGICNTDLEILKGYMDFKGVPGHDRSYFSARRS